jgi:hypothetical protein
MSRSGDDRGEMTTAADDSAAEEAFEAYLAGRPVPEEAADTFQGVAAFAGAVRATAIEPGRPNAALAELLATGLLVDQPLPSARTAKRRRRSAMFFFPALVAKILSAGAIAQAATGAGIVVVAVTGAGVAGVLPGPVQSTVATVVESVTPFELPHSPNPVQPADPGAVVTPATGTAEPTEATEPETTEPKTTEVEESTPAEPTSTAPNSFGKRVSEDAKDGGVDGHEISKAAHERNEARKSAGKATATATRTRDDDEAPETESHESGQGGSDD